MGRPPATSRPSSVSSEFVRPDERDDHIDDQPEGDQPAGQIVPSHNVGGHSRSNPRSVSASRKKPLTISSTKSILGTSHGRVPETRGPDS